MGKRLLSPSLCLSVSLSLGLSLTTNTTPTYNTITGKVLEKYKLWARRITGLLNILPLPVIIFKVSYNEQELLFFFYKWKHFKMKYVMLLSGCLFKIGKNHQLTIWFRMFSFQQLDNHNAKLREKIFWILKCYRIGRSFFIS